LVSPPRRQLLFTFVSLLTKNPLIFLLKNSVPLTHPSALPLTLLLALPLAILLTLTNASAEFCKHLVSNYFIFMAKYSVGHFALQIKTLIIIIIIIIINKIIITLQIKKFVSECSFSGMFSLNVFYKPLVL
jgi:hypothetical protein